MDEKVFKYLREHPELENTSRYSEFRFWRQVTNGSTPGEVKVLLDEPREQTIDPALMASIGEQHWQAVRDQREGSVGVSARLGPLLRRQGRGGHAPAGRSPLRRSDRVADVLDLGVFSTTPMPSAALTWIEPGASATLIWHGAAASQRPDGGRLYVVSGPILEQPPRLALLHPGRRGGRRLRGAALSRQVALPELRAFLSRCRVARGELVDDQQYVATDGGAAGARGPRRRGATGPGPRRCRISTTSTRSCPPPPRST